jgi:16S rRNA (cytosine967-C5)-methyltransferase
MSSDSRTPGGPPRSHPGQPRILLGLLGLLRPHWRSDTALPARIESLLRSDQRRGARDRRLYRELIYTALRHLPWVEPLLDRDPGLAAKTLAWLAADTPSTHALRAGLAGDWPEPPADLAGRAAFLRADPAEILPGWFRAHCPEMFSGAELDAQARRPPLWLRLQTDSPEGVFAEFGTLGWPLRRAPALGSAVRVLAEADVTKTGAFRSGRIEVQDLGSQLVLASVEPAPGGRWLDACAGAGGKTLQLARMLGPDGRVDAHDIRPAALEELRERAARAGAANVRILPRLSRDGYDGVLVDAPCSGSGTWRRSPHLKWCTAAGDVDRSAARQRELLAGFAPFVAPGGTLVYATCSLSGAENEGVLGDFLGAHPEFRRKPVRGGLGFLERGDGHLLLPSVHDSDGFFVAALVKK